MDSTREQWWFWLRWQQRLPPSLPELLPLLSKAWDFCLCLQMQNFSWTTFPFPPGSHLTLPLSNSPYSCLLGQAGMFPFTLPLARENTGFKQVAPAKLVQAQLRGMHNAHKHPHTRRSPGCPPTGPAGQEARGASSAPGSRPALWRKPSSLQPASTGSCLAATSLAAKLLIWQYKPFLWHIEPDGGRVLMNTIA